MTWKQNRSLFNRQVSIDSDSMHYHHWKHPSYRVTLQVILRCVTTIIMFVLFSFNVTSSIMWYFWSRCSFSHAICSCSNIVFLFITKCFIVTCKFSCSYSLIMRIIEIIDLKLKQHVSFVEHSRRIVNLVQLNSPSLL
jgi:hypothetical protein